MTVQIAMIVAGILTQIIGYTWFGRSGNYAAQIWFTGFGISLIVMGFIGIAVGALQRDFEKIKKILKYHFSDPEGYLKD